MPTVLDATVVNSAYDTSGNGGRKLVRLSNGWIIAIAWDSSGQRLNVYKSTDNGQTFSLLAYRTTGAVYRGSSIVARGTKVYLLVGAGNTAYYSYVIDSLTMVANTDLGTGIAVDSGQSDTNNVSLAINEAGTELHAAWASKNSTYANSFNIRYAKGTINADGSVTWGSVVQVTKENNAIYSFVNPSIAIVNGKPSIIAEVNGLYYTTARGSDSYARGIMILKNDNTLVIDTTYLDPYWSAKSINYNTAQYAQSSPSAIFVPQSVNGLANGRIWVAWHGTDSTDTAVSNTRISYSDDGGVTWSAMQKLTSGNTTSRNFPSITANKSGKVFVLVNNQPSGQVEQLSYDGTWSGLSVVASAGQGSVYTYPSTLFDLTVNFTAPLFIYKSTVKVGFYGTWTVTTVSVTPGDIGQKTDKANLLTYSITTDGTMSAITEKVNGVTVGTKNASSGQSLIVGLTQEQWDAIRFGRYADATGGKNTLTIEMGSEKWTYTFDKRPATDADIISATKAHKDIAEVVDPARRAKMASAIRSKGGSANDADAWETLEQAVEGIVIPKKASGTVTSSSSTTGFQVPSGGYTSMYYATIDMSILGFTPKVINLRRTDKLGAGMIVWMYDNYYQSGSDVANVESNGTDLRAPYSNGPTNIPVTHANVSFTWDAYE